MVPVAAADEAEPIATVEGVSREAARDRGVDQDRRVGRFARAVDRGRPPPPARGPGSGGIDQSIATSPPAGCRARRSGRSDSGAPPNGGAAFRSSRGWSFRNGCKSRGRRRSTRRGDDRSPSSSISKTSRATTRPGSSNRSTCPRISSHISGLFDRGTMPQWSSSVSAADVERRRPSGRHGSSPPGVPVPSEKIEVAMQVGPQMRCGSGENTAGGCCSVASPRLALRRGCRRHVGDSDAHVEAADAAVGRRDVTSPGGSTPLVSIMSRAGAFPSKSTPAGSSASSTAVGGRDRRLRHQRRWADLAETTIAGGPAATSTAGESGSSARRPSPSPSTPIQNRLRRSAKRSATASASLAP